MTSLAIDTSPDSRRRRGQARATFVVLVGFTLIGRLGFGTRIQTLN
jgi:hypothetical protein